MSKITYRSKSPERDCCMCNLKSTKSRSCVKNWHIKCETYREETLTVRTKCAHIALIKLPVSGSMLWCHCEDSRLHPRVGIWFSCRGRFSSYRASRTTPLTAFNLSWTRSTSSNWLISPRCTPRIPQGNLPPSGPVSVHNPLDTEKTFLFLGVLSVCMCVSVLLKEWTYGATQSYLSFWTFPLRTVHCVCTHLLSNIH